MVMNMESPADESRVEEIRSSEAESHIKVYFENELFSGDSWLKRPVKTVLDILPLLDGLPSINVLDLGCGVGRNAIPIVRHFFNKPCNIDCVDILEYAIEKLASNAKKYSVGQNINGIVAPIEEFFIKPEYYDLILAVSVLEHINSKASFTAKLQEIRDGLKQNGIACFIINTEVTERDISANEYLPPQFEVNLDTQELFDLLKMVFTGFKILKETVTKQCYEISRGSKAVELKSNVVTFAVQKKG